MRGTRCDDDDFSCWAPLMLLGFLGFMALGTYIVQQLWNWLLPALLAGRS